MSAHDVKAEYQVAAVGGQLNAMVGRIRDVKGVFVGIELGEHPAGTDRTAIGNRMAADRRPPIRRVRDDLQVASARINLDDDANDFFDNQRLAQSVVTDACPDIQATHVEQIDDKGRGIEKLFIRQLPKPVGPIGFRSAQERLIHNGLATEPC